MSGTPFVCPPPSLSTLSVDGTDARFPVRRVYCVGRNYAAHAVEMGHDPDQEPPFFFQKNPDNLIADATHFPYPKASKDVHHEVELLVALQTGGDDIAVENAFECVFGYGVALDMTRRDLQGQMKQMGRPWEVGKAFEMSAPAGPLVPSTQIGHPSAGEIWLKVNDDMRQSGDLNQMLWKTSEVISILSGLFTLQPGDVILTGTPAGVGPVVRGDRLHAHVEGVGDLQITVT
ncbi:fumarylacetoacetate hydrolase family protein [uncultured Roseobacter sp.]|uniref:fumarylacetoacetate hydrolase family protein n=1 Tax=uncultured Roseobacter sp. TaxID=114847 RepID=UPI002633F4D1|nr:fumarylacetoacetate hydrolase family protein [uncultured Roseobacter sp.]